MAQLYGPAAQTVFYAADQYPRSNQETRSMGLGGKRNEKMRAMTIAAFRVAQNETQIDDRIMDADLLYCSSRAEVILQSDTGRCGADSPKEKVECT